MFDDVYRAFPDATSKHSIREFIGFLNKRTQRRYKIGISSTEEDLHHQFLCRGYLTKMDDCSLVKAITYQDYQVEYSLVPLYQQVIQQSHISLIKLAKLFHTKSWVQIKTDEIVVEKIQGQSPWKIEEHLSPDFKEESMDETKRQKLVTFEKQKHHIPTTEFWSFPQHMFQWKDYEEDMWSSKITEAVSLDGGLIIGSGGSGKSFGCKLLQERVGAEYVLKTAATHKAAILLGGATIHSALSYTEDSKAFMVNFKKQYPDVTHIIVDEFFMLGRDIIRALHAFKKKLPHLKIYLLGDPEQLPPVEQRIQGFAYDMENNPLVMEICGYNRIQLRTNHRNAELTTLYNQLKKGSNMKELMTVNVTTNLHIVYDNFRQKLLGKQTAERICKEKKRKRYVIDDFVLFKDCELYASTTNKKMGYVNQESFRIKDVIAENKVPSELKLRSILRGKDISIPIQNLKDFQYNYARTLYGVQGETLKVQYTIHC